MSGIIASTVEAPDLEPIAIVGVACRFPGGVTDPQSYWALLRDGVDAIREIDRDGLDPNRFYDARPQTPGRMATKWGGFLDGLEDFDAGFFGISPREAATVAPEHRLLLETVWEAHEDAGIDPTAHAEKRVGVFVGQWVSDFESRMFANLDELTFHATTGSGRYATAGRISFVLDATGPSMSVDTACSSSLVAVHLACQSLRAGESTLAVAAGVNVLLEPTITIAYSQSGMMALDGRCKFGDANGDGYVRSEGAGVVLLKTLTAALNDGDPIRAVIRGSAVNNDGRASGDMSRPSRRGQAAMLRTVYAGAAVDPGSVTYVEAHGTGTRAGDPVELGALADVVGTGRSPAAPCHVGSVKTNIGHTEGAAGLAGLIKCVLMMEHGEIPASLHLQEPNPAVSWEDLPLEIPTAHTSWDAPRPRRAGVSSFGVTGTNAHVILEEAPEPPDGTDAARSEGAVPLLLSAACPAGLAALATRYADVLESGQAALHDLAATIARHRAALEHRAVFVGCDRARLAERLRRFAAGDAGAADSTGQVLVREDRRVAFAFPGQGGQWLGMGRELLMTEPAFAAAIDRCDAALPADTDWRVREQLLAEPGDGTHRLDEIAVLQPTLLAVEIALAAVWRAWGVEPTAVIGHSMGEVGAAHSAGALTLEEAMLVICRRSELMQRTSGAGAMALLELPTAEAATWVADAGGRLVVAVENSPRSTVVSGAPTDVAALLAECERRGVFGKAVQVDVASHSPQMDPLVPELVAAVAAVTPRATTTVLFSTVDGAARPGETWDASYWGRNLRQPVRFGPTLEGMLADGIDAIVEIGPHPTLLPSVAQVPAASPPVAVGSLRRGAPERAALLASIGTLWAAGHAIDWSRHFPTGSYRRIRLPNYPWQRERHWSDAAVPAAADAGSRRTPALDPEIEGWLSVPSWSPAPVPAPTAALNGRWIILASEPDASALATAISTRGGTPDLTTTLEEAVGRVAGATGVVVLPSFAGEPFAPIAVMQALLAQPQTSAVPRVWWLTAGAQHLDGDAPDERAVDQAAAWGTMRVLAVEHPDWWGGAVDLDPARAFGAQANHIADVLAVGDDEDQCALRAGTRSVLRIVREAPPGRQAATRWRDDRSYLVTGGLGGVAEHVTRAMVAGGARRLVLMGRSALPPRTTWADLAAGTEAARRVAAVRALEHAGAAVHLLQADAADEAQVRAALDRFAAEEWPPIAGVVHAAAVVDNHLTHDLDAASYGTVLAAKLRGAQILDRLLPELDLFIVLSSIASFWPMAGVANYAAANAGVDALAEQRRARGQHALSIQFGPWRHVGLHGAAIPEMAEVALAREGVGAIAPEHGVAWFDRLLATTQPVVAVAPVDWTAFHAAHRGRLPARFAATPGAGAAGGGSGLAVRLAAAGAAERRALLESNVRETVAAVLRLAPAAIDGRRPFGSLGLDSLMALELRNQLEIALERPLSATLAWNYPTIATLVGHLDGLVAGAAPVATDRDESPTPEPIVEDSVSTLLAGIAALSDDDAVRALRGER